MIYLGPGSWAAQKSKIAQRIKKKNQPTNKQKQPEFFSFSPIGRSGMNRGMAMPLQFNLT